MSAQGLINNLSAALKAPASRLRALAKRVKVERLLVAATLCVVFAASLALRLLRLSYGYNLLDEFDPYFQYWMAKYVVDRGWAGFAEWFSWFKDPRFWYPYGRDVVHTAFPGVAFTGAFIHLFLTSLGLKMDLMTTCAFLPAFLGSLTVVLLYHVGREVDGRAAGLYASVFMAFSAAYLSRTIFGFFDDESVGIFAFVCALVFYFRSLKRGGAVLEALIAGAFLGYMASAWGAATYVINLLALHAILLTLPYLAVGSVGRHSRELLTSYSATMSTALLLASLVPKHGPGFLTSGLSFQALIALALLVLAEAASKLPSRRMRIALTLPAAAAIMGGLIALWALGYLAAPERYFSVFLPTIRSPLVASVAEHQPVTWFSFFLDYQLVIPLSLLGLYFLARRGDAVSLFMVVAGLSTIYAAAGMARLLVFLDPLLCVLAGVGFSRVVKALASRLTAERESRRRVLVGLDRRWAGLALIMLVISFTPLASPLVRPITYSSSSVVARASGPQMILASDFMVSAVIPDWLNTLAWMKNNLPSNAVVASWWDYGYHVAVMAERASTCDNAALSHTHIAKIATAFLSNETEALRIYRELGVTHVVVFGYVVPYLGMRIGDSSVWFYASLGHIAGDDFTKSQWMALIAGLNPSDYQKSVSFITADGRLGSLIVPAGGRAADAVLYRMLFNNHEGPLASRGPIVGDVVVDEQSGRLVNVIPFNVKPLQHFKLVYASEPNNFVLVYEVIYD
jgi:dolichyl-diphosphooligosaccharide--protein glycosyltransferase